MKKLLNKINSDLRTLTELVQRVNTDPDSVPIELFRFELGTLAYNKCVKHGIVTIGDLRHAMTDPVKYLSIGENYRQSVCWNQLNEILK